MKPDFTQMQFNSIEDIDQLIEAIEKMPENPNKENTFLKVEATRRSKMLGELKKLRAEAEELAKQEKHRKAAEVVALENDGIEVALKRAKEFIKVKKQGMTSQIRQKSSTYYSGESRGSESRSSESRRSSIDYTWGYSSGESRCDGESRW